MPDDDLTAELAKATRIADGLQFACRLPDKKPDFTACGGPAAEAYWEYFTPARVVSLLAALRAVLELAEDWDAEAAKADARAQRADEREADSACSVLYTRATALNESARTLREAIIREITGKGESDDGYLRRRDHRRVR